MKRERPHIPVEVKCRVALRQLFGNADLIPFIRPMGRALIAMRTDLALKLGCQVGDLRLDHNPALRLRPYNPRIKNVARRYTPNANDPNAMLYRSAHDHHIKTNVRGDGAKRSDTSEIKRERRREKPKRKSKRRWGSRPIQARKNAWPKGRKIRSRNDLRSRT